MSDFLIEEFGLDWSVVDERVTETVAGYLKDGELATIGLTNSDVGQLFVDLGIELDGERSESLGGTSHSVTEIPVPVGAGSSTYAECAEDYYEDIAKLFRILEELESGERVNEVSMNSQAGVQNESLTEPECVEKEVKKVGRKYGEQIVSNKGFGVGGLGSFVTDVSLDRTVGDSTSGGLNPSAREPFIVFGGRGDKKMVAKLLGNGSVMDLKRCPVEQKVVKGSDHLVHSTGGSGVAGGGKRKRRSGPISNGVVEGSKKSAKTGLDRISSSSGAPHRGISCGVRSGLVENNNKRREIISKGDNHRTGCPSQEEEDRAWQVLFGRGVSRVTAAGDPNECWIRNSRTIAEAALAGGNIPL